MKSTKIQRLIAGVIAFIMLSLMAVPALATGIEIDSSPSDAEKQTRIVYITRTGSKYTQRDSDI